MSFSSMLQMARGREPPDQKLPRPGEKGLAESKPVAANAQRTAKPPSAVKAFSALGPPSSRASSHNTMNGGTLNSSQSVMAGSVSRQPKTSRDPAKLVQKPAQRPVQKPRSSNSESKGSLYKDPASVSPRLKAARALHSGSHHQQHSSKLGPGRTSHSSSPTSQKPQEITAKKKLSFKEVMSQASKIDNSKLEVNLRTKDSRKQPVKETLEPRKSRLKPPQPSNALSSADTRPKITDTTEANRFRWNEPAPVAQPLPEILEKRRRQREAQRGNYPRLDESDNDLADFIASEDEDEVPLPRNEDIWGMFNRGPRKYHDAYSSDDDMEARGDEILNEEKLSASQARREDAEEERKLALLAQRKRQRKGH